MDDKQLKIYSASAGSGKTYTLAKEFISLLVERPEEYKNILAVTFTVKATNEMKERILKNLYEISINDEKAQGLIADQVNLFNEKLKDNEPKITPGEIRTRCRRALNYFLNDYSQFNIMTIDGFVQKVIRAFAFEANLPAHYEITLDKEDIVQQAITNLYAQIKTDPKLENWIRQYTQETMEDSGRWNVERSISSICGDLIDQKEKLGTGTDIDKLTAFVATLKKEIDNGKKIIVDTLKKAKADLLSIPGFKPEYVKAELLKKLISFNSEGDLFNLFKTEIADNDEIKHVKEFFYDSKTPKKQYEKESKAFKANNLAKLDDVQAVLESLKKVDLTNYYTALAIKNNIYTTGLWNYIQNNISNITTAESLMLISQSNELLQELIAGSNIPFIYEKVGAKFDNIMIDEFQDTSHIQWENFRPLVDNAMGTRGALVVGDVKQAIYRWRNSDWNLLAHQIKKDFEGKCENEDLKTNYRSEYKIIEFNNTIFPRLTETFSKIIKSLYPEDEPKQEKEIKKIYEEVVQNPPDHLNNKDKKGYVQIRKIEEPAEKGQTDKQLAEMLDVIKELQEKHYKLSDICILVRGAKDGTKVAQFLATNNVKVLSSDALLLNASPIVQAIIAHLKYIDNQQNNALLAYALTYKNTDDLLEKWKNKDDYAQEILALRGMGLIEMTNAIIEKLDQDWVNNQLIFVDAFRNLIYTFTTKNHPNLADFLEYYDSKKDKLTIEMPPNLDAIQLMTIHKSKGLEFPIVLIPYLNWEIFKKDKLWCKDFPAPFNITESLQLNVDKTIEKTHVNTQYADEVAKQVIDNLNLLYVAFTRPKIALYAWTEPPKKHMCHYGYMFDFFNEEQFGIPLQPLPIDEGTKKTNNDKIFEITTPLPTSPWDERDKKKFGRIALTDKTKDGTAKHAIMEKIVTLEDLEKYAQKAVTNGQMNNSESTSFVAEVATEINNLNIAHWFDGSMTVYNETAMVAPDNEKRPDRVMVDKDNNVHVVDYKFYKDVTDTDRKTHLFQVRNYMWMLKKTNLFNRVTGNVWYYNQHEIMPVTL